GNTERIIDARGAAGQNVDEFLALHRRRRGREGYAKHGGRAEARQKCIHGFLPKGFEPAVSSRRNRPSLCTRRAKPAAPENAVFGGAGWRTAGRRGFRRAEIRSCPLRSANYSGRPV